MIKVSVIYRKVIHTKFDVEYYKNFHLPMVINTIGNTLLNVELNVGKGKSPYVAIAHLTFGSMAGFKEAFLPHLGKFQEDVPNFTSLNPEMQISDVLLISS
ncbi:MAG: hypothetical protein ACJA2N_001145 [Salibacteraceae bacterium]|jgi:uncharacterized protein (TIGR02118 family)